MRSPNTDAPTASTTRRTTSDYAAVLPRQRELFYAGTWHKPSADRYYRSVNPATGDYLGPVADAGAEDIDRAVRAAQEAFPAWRATKPSQRGALLREAARRLRGAADDLALLDAADCGNPRRAMLGDVEASAVALEFFAGLVTEMKGETIPLGEGVLNYTVREPLGVVARINPFNHPFMFAAQKVAAPLAAGNTVVVKAADQTPLSALALAALWADLFPAGVFNVVTGRREAGAALASHPLVAKVSLIGSIPTGRAVMRAAADTVKKLTLELGGKNALIAYPDADPRKVAAAAVHGMNLKWTAGQSCGSTSRAFLHEAIHDQVVNDIAEEMRALRCGLPTDPDCEVGCITSREQYEKIMGYIRIGKEEGARLVCGGVAPDDARLKNGTFILPTLFADVKPTMRIAREEIFGPVLSVLRWSDEDDMFRAVNGVEYGLTAAIWTRDLARAHRAAARVEAGYVWINGSSSHFLGVPFGGYKQSGLGREECLQELLDCTQIKNVNVNFAV